MPVNDYQRSILCLTHEQGIGITHLRQNAFQRRSLSGRVNSPITTIRLKLIGADTAKLLDAITKAHGGNYPGVWRLRSLIRSTTLAVGITR